MSLESTFRLSSEESETLGEWRTERQTIVFTNGCFDLLHPGHIDIIRRAKALGDRLVVGLNSDDSVRRLKGEGRPLVAQNYRKEMLLELRSVDMVILFAEDTPLELIKAVHPDTLVKGEHYRNGIVVGRECVESYGGRVELLPLVPGFSTSDVIRRIKTDQH